MPTPAVTHILETALYVADLDRSEAFYRDLFGWPTKMADARMRALAISGEQILLLFARGQSAAGDDTPRGRIPGHDGGGTQHVALAVEDTQPWRQRLSDRGIRVESEVRPEQGGHSPYFRDPDGHLIEVATAAIWKI